jgi:hypothetical protein
MSTLASPRTRSAFASVDVSPGEPTRNWMQPDVVELFGTVLEDKSDEE